MNININQVFKAVTVLGPLSMIFAGMLTVAFQPSVPLLVTMEVEPSQPINLGRMLIRGEAPPRRKIPLIIAKHHMKKEFGSGRKHKKPKKKEQNWTKVPSSGKVNAFSKTSKAHKPSEKFVFEVN